jgi:hypothetical protein
MLNIVCCQHANPTGLRIFPEKYPCQVGSFVSSVMLTRWVTFGSSHKHTCNVLEGVSMMFGLVPKISLHVHDHPRISPLHVLTQPKYVICNKIKLFLWFFTTSEYLCSNKSDLSTKACECNKCIVARWTSRRLVCR